MASSICGGRKIIEGTFLSSSEHSSGSFCLSEQPNIYILWLCGRQNVYDSFLKHVNYVWNLWMRCCVRDEQLDRAACDHTKNSQQQPAEVDWEKKGRGEKWEKFKIHLAKEINICHRWLEVVCWVVSLHSRRRSLCLFFFWKWIYDLKQFPKESLVAI